ncbi:MAG: bifunctional riboflavin kinase/FAD synthetase [candidate division Zixibacteria bacterium]|nr:bifunctional riboflavin kinase/FAD synthetase [candidate division Zixibacteria bacterium]MBU1469720.1 bifunctional riboflavin kinase/FAD synthetase [candidate division Zixibacteria bacterium]MBU2626076.1 bifunctional riboflavin kinase/FAD synthetase [candidate division Zixibacteria bacterium]
MKVIQLNLDSPNAFPDGCVLTQGTFDGIHLGHCELLRQVIEAGQKLGLPTVLLTFKPHPAMVLRPSRRIPLLTVFDEKTSILEKIGLDYMALFEFNTQLAILQAEDYVREILAGKFGAKVVVVGYNHTFGRKREGNGRFLEEIATKYGFEAKIQTPVLYENEPVHSSRIRKELFEGRFRSAMTMLNRPYRISGEVVKGRGVGRGLGYPTINVRAHKDKLIPMSGVYAAKVRINGNWLPGMMYIGEDRSIFDFEVAIFDFEGDMYHRQVDVDIFDRTRDSIKFESADKLVVQIAKDEKEIRDILSRT